MKHVVELELVVGGEIEECVAPEHHEEAPAHPHHKKLPALVEMVEDIVEDILG